MMEYGRLLKRRLNHGGLFTTDGGSFTRKMFQIFRSVVFLVSQLFLVTVLAGPSTGAAKDVKPKSPRQYEDFFQYHERRQYFLRAHRVDPKAACQWWWDEVVAFEEFEGSWSESDLQHAEWLLQYAETCQIPDSKLNLLEAELKTSNQVAT